MSLQIISFFSICFCFSTLFDWNVFFSQEVLEISQVSLEELVRRHCHLVVLLSLPPSLSLYLSIYLSIYQTIYLYIYLTLFLFLVYLILNVLG